MKNKSNFLLLAALLGGLLFNFLFWKERLALNLFIYSAYLLMITVINPDVIKSTKLKIYGLAHILASVLVVINNSDLTLVSYYISLILFIGFAHNQQIRTVFITFLAAVIQMVTVPFNALQNLSKVRIGNLNLKPVFKLIKYIFIPFIIVTLFTCLYSAANEVFGNAINTLLTNVSNLIYDVLHFFFKDLIINRIAFFIFGLILSGGLIITFFNKGLALAELKYKEQLLRIRSEFKKKTVWFEFAQVFTGDLLLRKLALKTEFITGLISFIALNLLLLFLNIIDIWWLWLGKGKALAETNYSAELHDGTNALIFSIIMAMAVIVYFFRGNLNFYSKSKVLRILAYAWMIQNFILIISVFIRDAHYIEFHGLTHKRIGVIVFAILCIIGLATVYFKVAKQKTFFYLLKINGNIWFVLLLAFSIINWDVFIVKYNLAHKETIAFDSDYLLSLSDKTLPVLDKNRMKLQHTESKSEYGTEIAKPETLAANQQKLNQRIGFFKERYERVSWVSWNLQDWTTAKYFNNKQIRD
ncbi:DUF4173 domain-containing protein [Pedobacter frigidisoli]|uniref:DUF4173 domain-containing protein n=1 Tax=Pedobacter frigidisoli TaxID=2530455 RepID=A0A4R0P7S3_9SPHI|nr:DUF4173 domain-containing protein [Pedobacter frigidisoli]TCD10598.1 DUF4173 domain-containing protein [Pedobacter frigidisoli]